MWCSCDWESEWLQFFQTCAIGDIFGLGNEVEVRAILRTVLGTSSSTVKS